MTVSDLLSSCLNDDAVVEIFVQENNEFCILNYKHLDHLDSGYAIDHYGDLLVKTFGFHAIRYIEPISGIVEEVETIRIYV